MDIVLRHQIEQILEREPTPNTGAFLNELMVEFLVCKGFVQSEALREALLHTPRHEFLPGVDLRHAYRDQAIATARDEDGWFESSCSTPSIVCTMLESLHLEEATSILELGTGTGYTGALMSRCAPQAKVVSLEVLEDVALASTARLSAMGLDSVEVRASDGSNGEAGPGPYDRIVLACGAKQIPNDLVDLLMEGGLLVIPVGSCIFRFEKRGRRLVGHPLIVASFIAYADGEPQSQWRTNEGKSVLWPHKIAATSPELGAPEHAIDGPAIESHQIASWLLWASLQYPDNLVTLSERDGAWGFGLHDDAMKSTVICRMEGELSFRHYGDRTEQTRFECWGDPAVNDRFMDLSQDLADLDWPGFECLKFTVDLDAPRNSRVQKNQFLVGPHLWHCEVLDLEVFGQELASMTKEPGCPAGVNE